MKKILFIKNMTDDQRLSMDIYADMLERSLGRLPENNFIVEGFQPNVSSWFIKTFGIRLARYLYYPFVVLGKKANIYHIIDHSYSHLLLFINKKKCVVTVHDLIPLLRWKGLISGYENTKLQILALLSQYSIKRAKYIIAVSNNTKNDLIKYLNINPAQISVIYSGIDQIFKNYSTEKKAESRQRLFGDTNSSMIYILITGVGFQKNHITSLKVLQTLLSAGYENIRLVKTGYVTKDWIDLTKSLNLDDKVISLGVLPREILPDVYNSVDVLLYPSLYEGFGWPPLESMACGTPVVASNVASLPEAIGDAGVMLDPYNYNGFASEIIKIIKDIDYRQQYIQKGIIQAGKFSWDITARHVMNVYKTIICSQSEN